ncbi:MAG: ECF transporter S component [Oscillospiraceae bacterium]|jgi:riboflavin transporter FmnP|nr:ECF transporter S component [Oscillospiraceae bacterium]
MKKITTKQLVVLAMFAAIAYILMLVSRFLPPIVPAVEFLKYDPKDIMIVISGMLFGVFGVVSTAIISSFLELITVSTTGFFGFVMNVMSSISFAILPTLLCRKKITIFKIVLGCVFAIIAQTAFMTLWNIIVSPYYMGVSRKVIMKLLKYFIQFNLIKSSINAIVTIIFFPSFKKILLNLKSRV